MRGSSEQPRRWERLRTVMQAILHENRTKSEEPQTLWDPVANRAEIPVHCVNCRWVTKLAGCHLLHVLSETGAIQIKPSRLLQRGFGWTWQCPGGSGPWYQFSDLGRDENKRSMVDFGKTIPSWEDSSRSFLPRNCQGLKD